MTTGHTGSFVPSCNPLGAWLRVQTVPGTAGLEPDRDAGWQGWDHACPSQPRGQKRHPNYSCCFELMQNQWAGTPLVSQHLPSSTALTQMLPPGSAFRLREEARGSISGTDSSEWEPHSPGLIFTLLLPHLLPTSSHLLNRLLPCNLPLHPPAPPYVLDATCSLGICFRGKPQAGAGSPESLCSFCRNHLIALLQLTASQRAGAVGVRPANALSIPRLLQAWLQKVR